METAQWPQQGLERRARPHREKALNCPRCNSTNTKFCYYNNYSLSQPRYFCKSCRRYWTDGGSLRNVPVGGGSRKNKRFNSSSSSSSSSSQPSSTVASSPSLLPSKLSSFSLSPSVSALEPIRSGISSRRLISFDAPSSSKKTELSANGRTKLRASAPWQSLQWQELEALGVMKQGEFGMGELMWPSKVKVPLEYGVGGMEERKEGGEGELALPFEDLKQVRSACDEIMEGVDPTLFWEGVMGNGEGGGW